MKGWYQVMAKKTGGANPYGGNSGAVVKGPNIKKSGATSVTIKVPKG
jgi:hypothetical protein